MSLGSFKALLTIVRTEKISRVTTPELQVVSFLKMMLNLCPRRKYKPTSVALYATAEGLKQNRCHF